MDKETILNNLYHFLNSEVLRRRLISYFRKDEFRQWSYLKWAVQEILRAIEKSDLPPYIAVEEFAKKMDDYSCNGKNSSIMFSVAHDTALWIMDIIIKQRRNK